MEFVPLSDTVLNYLAEDDRELQPYFRGVFSADQLPLVSKKRVNAYIVNTDPASQPGEHCPSWHFQTPTTAMLRCFGYAGYDANRRGVPTQWCKVPKTFSGTL